MKQIERQWLWDVASSILESTGKIGVPVGVTTEDWIEAADFLQRLSPEYGAAGRNREPGPALHREKPFRRQICFVAAQMQIEGGDSSGLIDRRRVAKSYTCRRIFA